MQEKYFTVRYSGACTTQGVTRRAELIVDARDSGRHLYFKYSVGGVSVVCTGG